MKRYLSIILVLLTCGTAYPANKSQIFDPLLVSQRAGGVTLAAGKAYFYVPGSTTLKPIYLDRNSTQPAANPYTLSADGTAELYGDGLYDISVRNSANVEKFFWEDVNIRDIARELVYFDTLADAVTTIGTTKTTLIVAADTTTDSVTIPTNIELQTTNGSIITVNSGKTLTINGPVHFPDAQVFAGTGTVLGLKEAKPEWFGTNTTPGTTSMSDAIQKAANTGAGKIILGDTTYLVSSAISLPTGVELAGMGRLNTIVKVAPAMADFAFKVYGGTSTGTSKVRGYIHDLTIDGQNSATALGGIFMDWVYIWTLERVYVKDFAKTTATGFHVNNGFNILFLSCQANMGTTGTPQGIGARISSSTPGTGQNNTQIKFDDCLFQYNLTGVQWEGLTAMDGLSFVNSALGNNTTGMDFLAGTYHNVTITENHIEYNETGIKTASLLRGANINNNLFWDDTIGIDLTSAQNIQIDLNVFKGNTGTRTPLKANGGSSIMWGNNAVYSTAYSGNDLTGVELMYVPISTVEVVRDTGATLPILQKSANNFVFRNTASTNIGDFYAGTTQPGQSITIRIDDSFTRFYPTSKLRLKEGGIYGNGSVFTLYTPDGVNYYETGRYIPRDSVIPSNASSVFYTYTHQVGDIRYSNLGSNVGWRCTVAGSSGATSTWASF
jgi:hypothetical protein